MITRWTGVACALLLAAACATREAPKPGIPDFSSRLAESCDAEGHYERCLRLTNMAAERVLQCSKASSADDRFSDRCRVERAQSEAARSRLEALRGDRTQRVLGEALEADRERTEAAEGRTREKREAKERKDAARLRKLWIERAQERCAEALTKRYCADAPEGAADDERAKCDTVCAEGIQKAFQQRVKQALESCGDGYVESQGKTAVCEIALPQGAAVESADVDREREACEKSCRADGPKLLAAAKKDEQTQRKAWRHVVGYKHCVMAVETSAQGRRYRLHDRQLYAALMSEADTRCRKAHNCDWVEKHTPMACTYGN